MAVSSTATDYSGLGTGTSATYGTGIYANASDQIKVYANGVLQTLGVNYSLSGIGSAGGVDVLGTFTLGAALYIERVTPITQLVDTQNNETILEDVLDAEFDKLTMIDQEQQTQIDRALKVPKGETTLTVPALAQRAGKYFAFDVVGNPVAASGTGTDIGLRADLAALTGATLVGFSHSFPGGAGAVSAKLRETPSLKDAPFLATGDGVADDTAAASGAQASSFQTIAVPAGTFNIGASLLLTAKFRGVGTISRGGRKFNNNDTEVGALGLHGGLVRIGDLDQLRRSFASASTKIVFWGDSITEGLSQIGTEDSWARLVQDEMRRRAPGKTLIFENFSISGRGVGEANSPAYVGTAGAVTPGTNFNQPAGGSGPIPDITLWPGGTIVGKSWREHVRDRAPDLLIIALSINDTADPNAVYAVLRSLIANYISTWAKVPSIVICTPTMPTQLLPTQLAQQLYIEGNGHALRTLADELNVSLVDHNRLWLALRDGVDVARQRFASYPGATDYTTLVAGAAPAAAGSTLTFSGFGIVHRPVLHRDLVARADFALSGAQVGAIWARSKVGDPNKAYVVQIERGAPQVAIYYNSGVFASSALPAAASYKVIYLLEGIRHRVYVDANDGNSFVLRIDAREGSSFTNGYIEGRAGIQGDAGVVVSNVAMRLGYPRQIGPQTMSDALLLGDPALAPNGDYATNPLSLGGNSLNHPTILGYYHGMFAAWRDFFSAMQDAAAVPASSTYEQPVAVVNGANQNVALPAGVQLADFTAPTAPYSIGGLTGGVSGRRVKLFNYTNFNLTLTHQDAGSDVANRFALPSSVNLVVPPLGCVEAVYATIVGASGQWIVHS